MTHFTILWLGHVIGAAVYAAASVLPGSAVLSNIFFDSSIDATPAIYYNTTEIAAPTASGFSLTSGNLDFGTTNSKACTTYGTSSFTECYQETAFTATGASAGTKYYDVASILSPYTGTGTLKRVHVECPEPRVTANISVGIVTATTSSGTGILDRDAAGTGSVIVWQSSTGSGANLPIWRVGQYVKVSSSARFYSNAQCLLRVWSTGTLLP